MRLLNYIRNIIYKKCDFNTRIVLLRKNGVNIGDGCEIYPNVNFGSEPYLIEIGNNVRIASGVKITTHDGGLWVLRNNKLLENADKFGKVSIGNNVHIGIDTIIMPNVTIGNNVIIGAGSIVTKNIPSNSVAVGCPAKVIESIDEYYNKVKDKVVYTKNMNHEEKKKYIMEVIKNEEDN